MVRGGAILLSLLVGCQFARPADVLPDAGPDAPTDAPTDARPELVQGQAVFRYVVDGQVVDESFDLSAYTVQALIPNGSGFTTAAGVARADGSFEIDNVTPGATYLLRIGRSYYVTDQHSLLLRTLQPRRAGVQEATQPTPVTFQVATSTAFGDADWLTATSVSADVQAALDRVVDQTSSTSTIDWMTRTTATYGGVGRLPDSTAGDDFWVLHLGVSPVTAAAPARTTIIAAADVGTSALRDGQSTTVSATLTPPSTTLALPSALALTGFTSGHSPMTRGVASGITCAPQRSPAPSRSADGTTFLGTPLLSVSYLPPLPTSLALPPPFGDPFPATWSRFCVVQHQRARALRIPNTTVSWELSTGTQRVAPASAIVGTPIQPPSGIRIRGLDGDRGGLLRNDGMPLDLSWTGSGQATQYNVTIYQLRAQGSATRFSLLATVSTPTPNVTIPAELLASSDFITFVVSAVNGTNRYADGELTPEGTPGGMASAATAMFRWSSTCGDGTPDIGEACDTTGETAGCDSDCTTAVCGDGVRNAAAGELCDGIVDTLGCDSDCTANQCGDGHVNSETEQCDDGGTVPGDGCSATCTTE